MKTLKEINFVVLPVVIWIATIIYVVLFKVAGVPAYNLIMDNSSGSFYPFITAMLVLINSTVQVLIICRLTLLANKKLDFSAKQLVLSLPILYLLFLIFHLPSLYMFVYTDEWYLIFKEHPTMPSWKASIFITLQFGVVMLITTLVASRKKKLNSDLS